jgi:serine/threonine-protein kinase
MQATRDETTLVLDLPVREGAIFAGKYRVDRVLGSGGMGMVLKAKHVELDGWVAIKVLLPGVAGPDRIARFTREARAAAKLKGDNVARVIDLGTVEGGMPYMVMEYLEGEDLDQRLRRCGPLQVAEAIDFVTQACEAMAEAHAHGIVHRDLKNANLFIVTQPDGSERIKVLDFGIAKVLANDETGQGESMTRTLAIMGSPTYMSPEQLKSTRNVDARADIWALGVILYELLTERVPFDGDGMGELYANIAWAPPAPLDRSDVPEALEAIVRRCLEKCRDKRFRNVAELAQALAPFGPKRAADAAQRALDITRAAKPWPRVHTTKTFRHRKLIAVALAVAAASGTLAVRSCGQATETKKTPDVVQSGPRADSSAGKSSRYSYS